MSDASTDIPDREWFKPADVCVIAAIQPYVLRSWEKEFPTLGVTSSGGSARTYRRLDVALVLRIKQLVFGEGLTLAGVRRRLDSELPPVDESVAVPVATAAPEAKNTIADIRTGLKAILAILDGKKAVAQKSGWLRPKGQPTLLDLDAEPHDNGGGARPASKRTRRPAPPPAE